jgi:hypothetical protein
VKSLDQDKEEIGEISLKKDIAGGLTKTATKKRKKSESKKP